MFDITAYFYIVHHYVLVINMWVLGFSPAEGVRTL